MACPLTAEQTSNLLTTLYGISVSIHGYNGPETAAALKSMVSRLPTQLHALQQTAQNPDLPHVPPELVEYVDGGRNPDVYTREFVELTVRANQQLRGKAEAFKSFADVLRETIERADTDMAALLHPADQDSTTAQHDTK